MTDRLYRPDPLEDNSKQRNMDVGNLEDKHGFALIDHMLFYGATKAELEELDKNQVATLKCARLLR